jgi:hypothetical protein
MGDDVSEEIDVNVSAKDLDNVLRRSELLADVVLLRRVRP